MRYMYKICEICHRFQINSTSTHSISTCAGGRGLNINCWLNFTRSEILCKTLFYRRGCSVYKVCSFHKIKVAYLVLYVSN